MVLIAIAGASGSGKTTLARQLYHHLGPERCALIAIDSYYRDLSHLSPEERAVTNFDHPASLDSELLIRHLTLLSNRNSVEVPVYDFSTHTRDRATTVQKPAQVVILEGIYALYWPEIRQISDHRIFLTTPPELCLQRRIERDRRERGRIAESVMSQWSTTTAPMFAMHVAETKTFASIHVMGDADFGEVIVSIARLVAEPCNP